MSVVHRVRLPVGASVLVDVGHRVEPAEVLATRRAVEGGVTVPVAARLRRPATEAGDLLVVRPGAVLAAGDRLAADEHGHEVVVPSACVFLGYDPATDRPSSRRWARRSRFSATCAAKSPR